MTSFNMPLEYVAALLLFTNLCTVAVIVLGLYAKGYLGRKAPPRAAPRPIAPSEWKASAVGDPAAWNYSQTLGQDKPRPPDSTGVEGVIQARIDAENRIAKKAAELKMQVAMLESGGQAIKVG